MPRRFADEVERQKSQKRCFSCWTAISLLVNASASTVAGICIESPFLVKSVIKSMAAPIANYIFEEGRAMNDDNEKIALLSDTLPTQFSK
jgi:hypothetical protein